jgi:curved DNA-binding protein CbpA
MTAGVESGVSKFYVLSLHQVHPDKNSNPRAEAAFKRLADAFEVVGDPAAQAQYLVRLASQPQNGQKKRPRTEWAAASSEHSFPAPASKETRARPARSWADMRREFVAMEHAFEAANDERRNAQRAAADAKRERQDQDGLKRSQANALLADALGKDADSRAQGWRAFKGTAGKAASTREERPTDAPVTKTDADGAPSAHSLAASEEPACCWVCRRKFPSAIALQRHEQISELHQENLAKQKATDDEARGLAHQERR